MHPRVRGAMWHVHSSHISQMQHIHAHMQFCIHQHNITVYLSNLCVASVVTTHRWPYIRLLCKWPGKTHHQLPPNVPTAIRPDHHWMLNPKDHDCGMTNQTLHPSTQHQGNFAAGGDASALCAYENIALMHSLQPAWVLLALWRAVDLHKDIIQQQQHNRGERMSLANIYEGLARGSPK